MKIFPSSANPYLIHSKNTKTQNAGQPPAESGKLPDYPGSHDEKGTPGFKTREVLDNKEENLLHMLFGAEKPKEMVFYGRSQVAQIYKGQLLDVKG